MIPMINTLVLFMLFLSRQAMALTKSENAKMHILKTEIIEMDTLLFESAFNQYDATAFKKIISDDIEFYDDRYGLHLSNDVKSKTLIEKYSRPQNVTRKLTSCTIDKLGDFGAVQTGEHTFFINDIPDVSGKFIHIWERKDKDWKLKRIVSYGHKAIKNNT
jgi:hypothetical protein